MSKHTPGPWVVGISCENRIHCVDAFDNGELFEVCEVWGIDLDKIESEESRANARLISAAPDLLDACEKALLWMQSTSSFAAAEMILAEAISKAKGDSA